LRRKDRLLSENEALKIVDDCVYATISCADDESNIFSLPMSIVREQNKIYIHGAKSGSKSKLFSSGRICKIVCVSYAKTPETSPEKLAQISSDEHALGNFVFTTEYKSAILTTTAHIVSDENAAMRALRLLCEKYTPNYMEHFAVATAHAMKTTQIYEFRITEISGKAKIL